MVDPKQDIDSRLMASDAQIVAAELDDWRKLGQGLHTRYLVPDLRRAVELLAAIAPVADGNHVQARLGSTFVDLKLITSDAVYRNADGVELEVEWVTGYDLELAARISAIARRQGLAADIGAITAVELCLDTAHAERLAPVWSALLTGGSEAQGRGTLGHDVRDTTGRMPILWFQDTDEHERPRQRFHVDVQVPFDVAEQRIAAAVAAGAVIVARPDPTTTVLQDPDGNRACIGVYLSPNPGAS